MKEIIIVLGTFSTCLLSCKKNVDSNTQLTIPQVKSLVLKSADGSGEIDHIDFKYDQSNRVTDIIAYNFYSPIPYRDSIYHVYFYYQGNNHRPYEFRTDDFNKSETRLHVLSYDNEGNMVKDSSLLLLPSSTFAFYMLTRYSNNGNQISITDSSALINGTFHLPLVNDNIIKWADEYYEFDNNANPLNRLNVAPIHLALSESHRPWGSFWSAWTLSNKNNITRIKRDLLSNSNYRDTIGLKYTYNPEGLVQSRIYYNTGGFAMDTMIYTYN